MYAFAMAAVIFFCRVFPFLFFRDKRKGGAGTGAPLNAGSPDATPEAETRTPGIETFLSLVEKAAPPVAMTVLAFNAASGSIKEDTGAALPVLIASGVTAAVHLWKRNALLSIVGGTGIYMILTRIIMQ
jgi:branched-subunit amino acid transport protein AzlD